MIEVSDDELAAKISIFLRNIDRAIAPLTVPPDMVQAAAAGSALMLITARHALQLEGIEATDPLISELALKIGKACEEYVQSIRGSGGLASDSNANESESP